ncbi:MAG: RDD family protein [Terriglobia bacterium]
MDSRFRGNDPKVIHPGPGGVPYSREHERPLAFDFSAASSAGAPSAGISATSPVEQLLDQVFDQAFAEQTSRMPPVKLESVPLNPRSEIPGSSSFAENFTRPAARGSQIVQFAETPFSSRGLSEELEYAEVVCAPLAARFAAGLIDILLLLAGGCIFALLFLAAGGHLDKTPLDLGVALFIAAFWLFVYFAVFGSITRRTPGHAALGLEIRNLNGEPPTIMDSLLRAFGVLVSISALTLGLLWAALDSDGMGWHDHISGTVPSESAKSNTLQGKP